MSGGRVSGSARRSPSADLPSLFPGVCTRSSSSGDPRSAHVHLSKRLQQYGACMLLIRSLTFVLHGRSVFIARLSTGTLIVLYCILLDTLTLVTNHFSGPGIEHSVGHVRVRAIFF